MHAEYMSMYMYSEYVNIVGGTKDGIRAHIYSVMIFMNRHVNKFIFWMSIVLFFIGFSLISSGCINCLNCMIYFMKLLKNTFTGMSAVTLLSISGMYGKTQLQCPTTIENEWTILSYSTANTS